MGIRVLNTTQKALKNSIGMLINWKLVRISLAISTIIETTTMV